MQVPISVVIITFNEEKNIKRCLDSVRDVADDVVVVDSFSTDQTRKICEENGARFVQHAFEGHIEQKNWAITQARFPHVLSLDADEALSDELKKNILAVKNDWKADGYEFNRLTNFCGTWIRHCGWYPDTKLRLWDSRMGAWGGENPHDTYLMKPPAKIQKLAGDLLHYSFYTIAQHIDQINKFSTIKAREAHRKGKKSNLFKVLFSPLIKFFVSYFIKGGFLDGWYGFVICMNSAHSSFLKYAKLRELQNNQSKQ